MRRARLCWIVLLLAWSQQAWAQRSTESAAVAAPTSLCYHARPRPACSAFVLTNFGTYLLLGGGGAGGPIPGLGPLRGVADWGLMINVSPRDAIGASAFASVGEDGFALGPAARYRRWIQPKGSIDVALGTPLLTDDNNEKVQPGSVFGLVKWNANDWIGLAIRPELVRRRVVVGCGTAGCTSADQSHMRLSLGVEVGWVPGLAMTIASGFLAALTAAAVAAGGN